MSRFENEAAHASRSCNWQGAHGGGHWLAEAGSHGQDCFLLLPGWEEGWREKREKPNRLHLHVYWNSSANPKVQLHVVPRNSVTILRLCLVTGSSPRSPNPWCGFFFTSLVCSCQLVSYLPGGQVLPASLPHCHSKALPTTHVFCYLSSGCHVPWPYICFS